MSRTKRFTAFFLTDGNAPATGLSPTITIYNRTDATTEVSGASMTEVGGGLYEYNLVTYDYTKDYLAVADGTATLTGANRYVSMANESYVNDIADKMIADHGQGIWSKPASNLLGWNGDKLELSDKQIDKMLKKLIQELEKREINIPYTFPSEKLEITVQRLVDGLAAKAQDATQQGKLEVEESAQRIINAIKAQKPDYTAIFNAIELLKQEVTSTIEQSDNRQPILDAIKATEQSIAKTEQTLRNQIQIEADAIVDEFNGRFDENEKREMKKAQAYLEL